ncbi:uncharacterized protein LOC120843889 [Ixodes scapularis]|uniref:uncharacterized protein LOC120843889 n=1 Tax=Ixodes scapularis TaxID=6945 RepID=UPI001A9FC0ED|nr:uncharacterized protein LOC120843889 [Ixodes scapularis]
MALSRALPLQQNQLETYVTSLPRPPSYTRETKIAELHLAAHIAVHGSLASADHLTPLISDTFRDSFVASSLSMGRTKCTALVTKVLKPTFKELLLDDVRGDSCKLSISDCVGIGTDGASVMCGQCNSLYTRMRELNSNLVLVRCVCRSLHLACNEAVDVLPTQIDYLVRETFNWSSHSPKSQEFYKSIYSAINCGFLPRTLVGVCATRWLSIAGALRAILDQWTELKTHFDVAKTTERCYLAKMLFEMFSNEQNSLFVQFLSPIVDEFDKLNKVFQSEDPDPSKLYAVLSSFVKCLLQRVVLPSHASADSDWEGHLLHARACHMGSLFCNVIK